MQVPVLYHELQAIEHAPFWHTAACVCSQVRAGRVGERLGAVMAHGVLANAALR